MELLDIVDERGEPVGQTVPRETAHREGIRHRTSHVWIIRFKPDLQVLLQKRSENKDSFPGEWDTSSAGHIPAGSGWRESASRELLEELGIAMPSDHFIEAGMLSIDSDSAFYGKPFHDRQVSKIFLLFLDLPEDRFTVQKEELSEVRWFHLDQVISDVRNGSGSRCLILEELEMVRRAGEEHR